MQKVMVLLEGEEVAPRFDLCSEVWIGRVGQDGTIEEDRVLVLPRASAEELCQLIINENVQVVICGGIEAEYFDYLRWKKVQIFDSVVASYEQALQALAEGRLASEAILVDRSGLEGSQEAMGPGSEIDQRQIGSREGEES